MSIFEQLLECRLMGHQYSFLKKAVLEKKNKKILDLNERP